MLTGVWHWAPRRSVLDELGRQGDAVEYVTARQLVDRFAPPTTPGS